MPQRQSNALVMDLEQKVCIISHQTYIVFQTVDSRCLVCANYLNTVKQNAGLNGGASDV